MLVLPYDGEYVFYITFRQSCTQARNKRQNLQIGKSVRITANGIDRFDLFRVGSFGNSNIFGLQTPVILGNDYRYILDRRISSGLQGGKTHEVQDEM